MEVRRDHGDGGSQAFVGLGEALFDVLADVEQPVVVVEPDGRVGFANAGTDGLTGIPAADLVGLPVSEVATPVDPTGAERWAELRRALRCAGRDVGTWHVRSRSGHARTVRVAATAIPRPDGRGRRVVGMVRDAGPSRALAEHRARFEQSSLPQALAGLDGRLLSVNAALCDLLGYRGEDLLGGDVRDLVEGVDPERSGREMLPLFTGEVQSLRRERQVRRADGSLVPMLVDHTVLRDEDGPFAIAIFATDLSEVRDAEQRLAAEQALFRALTERSSDASVVVDADFNVVYVSPSAEEMFGYAAEDVHGRLAWDFVHPEDVEQIHAEVERVRAEPGASTRAVFRVRDVSGSWRWVEETLTNMLADPAVGGLVINLRGIGERVDAMRALRTSEARYRAIVNTAHEGIWAVSPEGETLTANHRLAQILGVSLEEVHGGELPAPVRAAVRDFRSAGRGRPVREVCVPDPGGGPDRLLSLSLGRLRFDDGAEMGTLVMVSDVTEARRNEELLRWRALHDPLTGVANRDLLAARLEDALGRRSEDGAAPLAVLRMDIDNLKLVNDTYGHETGDRLLQAITGVIGAGLGPQHTLARIGGDEFVALCEEVDEAGAVSIAEAVVDALARPVLEKPEPVYAGLSIGVAVSPPHEPDALLRAADQAMYRAKRTAGVHVCVEEQAADRLDQGLALANTVRDALQRQEVELHYQPIVDLGTGRAVGVEALLRHTDERLGAVPPDRFAACAERYGWSLDLDRIVMNRACRDFARLRAELGVDAPDYVSVNVSARTPGRRVRGLARQALGASGLPPAALMVELTEGSLMDDPEAAVEWMQALNEHGVRVALDDFGTGYSSLGRLHRLPLQALKIDRSFVQGAEGDVGALEITRSIVLLAGTFGLHTVAEGVETEAQAELMRSLGCDLAQGYLWSPARPLEELITRRVPLG